MILMKSVGIAMGFIGGAACFAAALSDGFTRTGVTVGIIGLLVIALTLRMLWEAAQ